MTDWQELAVEWREESPAAPLPDLRARVARESRNMRLLVAADVLVTIVIGGGVIGWALRAHQTSVTVLACATWTFLAVAWAFGVVNRANNWRPSTADTNAFLDLSIRRCRASISMVHFGVVLWMAEMAFNLTWVYRELSMPLAEFLRLWGVIAGFAATLAFLAASFWYRRKQRAELAGLLAIKKQVE